MTDLVAWLREQIDEDERAARAASPGGWTYGDVDSVAGGSLYDETRMIGSLHYEQPRDHDGSIVRHLLSHEADANGQHIARHDPARVLAEVAAKRELLLAYNSAVIDEGLFHRQTDSVAYHQAVARMSAWTYVVQQLAQPYVGRPGWRKEWVT
jgi:hypothetical protein